MSRLLAARLCREAARRQARYRRIGSVYAAIDSTYRQTPPHVRYLAVCAVADWLPYGATDEERILALCFAAAQLEDDDGR